MLTKDEEQLLELLSQAYMLFTKITGSGVPRYTDLSEAALHIHALQNMVLAQSAARVYPDKYRLLGEQVKPSIAPLPEIKFEYYTEPE